MSLLAGMQAAAGPASGLVPLRRLVGSPTESFAANTAGELIAATTVIDMLGLLTFDWPKLAAWQRQPARFDGREFRRLLDSGVRVFHPAVDLNDANPHLAALACMAGWNRLLDAHPRELLRIDNPAALSRVREEGKVGLVLGFQNADHFRDTDDVALFHRLGQRVSQLTYNERNRLGSGCTAPDAGGLSPFGRAIVQAMNRVGMAIDVSHCDERTSLEAIDFSAAPILITHSNCRALVNHPRCKSDAVVRALAARGGVMGITVLPAMVAGGRAAAIEDVLDHFDHVAQLVGPEHVGIGSDCDLDAIDPRTQHVRPEYRVRGLHPARRVFELAAGLLRRRYSRAEVAGILGGNFQRVLSQIWTASAPPAVSDPGSAARGTAG
jgi:membrane dipeptidase